LFNVQLTVTVELVTEITGFVIASAALSVMTAVPDLVGSCVLVAVTVTDVPVAGAVSKPAELMLPADADQVTAEA